MLSAFRRRVIPVLIPALILGLASPARAVETLWSAHEAEGQLSGTVTGFLIEVDGQPREVAPGEEVTVTAGSLVKLVDIKTAGAPPQGLVMNLRGFVSRNNDGRNTGEDRGATADTGRDLQSRFSTDGQGEQYLINAEVGPEVLASCSLRLVRASPGAARFGPAGSGPFRLSLPEAIASALAHNEDIRESFNRTKAAKASFLSAQGAYDLNMFNTSRYGGFDSLTRYDYQSSELTNATRNYLRADTGLKQRVITGGTVSTYYTYSKERMLGEFNLKNQAHKGYLTVEFAQSLLKGIGDKEVQGAIQNAWAAVEETEVARSLLISQVVLEVIRAYWTLESAFNNLRVSEKILALAQEVLRREEVRFDQGLSLGVDVDRARLAVRQHEYASLQYGRDVAKAQEQLVRLINYPGDSRETDFRPTSSPVRSVAPLPDREEARALALSERYELKQLALLLKQLNIEYDVNSNKLLPALDLNAGITTSNANDYLRGAENFKDTDRKGSWFVGATLSFPLENREARGAQERTSLLIRIADDRVRMMRRVIETEVRDALHNLALARDGLPVAQSAFEAAEQTVRGEVERFEMGAVNNHDLLSSHDMLGREEMNYHLAIVNYNLALAEYDFVRARLLNEYHIAVGKDSAYIF